MTQIKIVFLFAPVSCFEKELLDRVKVIVTEEYCKLYGCSPESIYVKICEGKSASKGVDMALFIASQEKRLNEGTMRGMLKKEVANRLILLFPRKSGFKGCITTVDDSFDENKSSAPQTAQRTGEVNEDAPGEYKKRAVAYEAVDPVYTYDMLVISPETRAAIEAAVGRIQYEQKVFDEWGLYAIMPNPVSALSFYGPPGTGKTMAADAIAHHLGKKIIHASYADIESKYHGEGPKNVSALFLAAEQQDAVLFIDEADSLLSKRLTNVSQGSEQAINSMRSQLLICLESFHGIVIFATNLVVNYDRAFLSRLISVEFPLPDKKSRTIIWKKHLRGTQGARAKLNIPLAPDVDEEKLAVYELCGREIRNAVVSACVHTCMEKLTYVDQAHLCRSAEEQIASRGKVSQTDDHTQVIAKALQSRLDNAAEVTVVKDKK